ncbi:hypothetical protein J1N35_034647 [Gossypium stocksii]|uniref:DUF4283 domain-containing protein n=1 Tax=Gossypium stocksii TaxID=47602 RepID=A0A9D3USG1_9ROSI|nr:hypothetical protein J1N35_034647 [Gossypium stocksii]
MLKSTNERHGDPRTLKEERTTKKVKNRDDRTLSEESTGTVIGYKDSMNCLTLSWQPEGSLQVVDLDDNYYGVKFNCVKDYTKSLSEGPWMIYEHYLIIQPWSRDFSTTGNAPSNHY